MKRFGFLINWAIFVLFVVILAAPAMADDAWKDLTHGIRDADLKAVACDLLDPDIVYLGSSKCIFKSVLQLGVGYGSG